MRLCPWWFTWTFDNPFRRLFHDPHRLLEPYVVPGSRVADIGCGMGYFTVELARLVGPAGDVQAVDVQPQQLRVAERRCRRAGVANRVRFIEATAGSLTLTGPVDFVLAFWMVHETEDARRFFDQVFAILKEQGKMLIAEPKMHVGRRRFHEIVQAACDAGFRYSGAPAVRLSRAALMERN